MAVSFTDRELDVMAVLWARGPSTVQEVRRALEAELAYTTVLTVLRTLEAKGHVDHQVQGKAHRYRALVARAEAGRSALGRLVDKVFGGSRELLLTHLVSGQLDQAEIERLRQVLNERLEAGDDPEGER
ncbi:MAG: BlaI/MecI/CopY family transcriptional regulator [Gemmatimonadales bacterium]